MPMPWDWMPWPGKAYIVRGPATTALPLATTPSMEWDRPWPPGQPLWIEEMPFTERPAAQVESAPATPPEPVDAGSWLAAHPESLVD